MSGKELKQHTRRLLRAGFPKIFIVTIFFTAFMTVLTELQYRLPGTNEAFDRFVEQLGAGAMPSFSLLASNFEMTGAALATLIALILPVLQVGYIGYCMRLSRGQDGDYRDLFDGFAYFPKVLIITILTGIIVFLWSLLLFIPGIIASYRYRQAYYILLESPDKGAIQCMRESKRMMKGRKLDLFLLDLSFIGWYLLNFLILAYVPFPLPLVLLWLYPYTGIVRAGFYNQLAGYVPNLPDYDEFD